MASIGHMPAILGAYGLMHGSAAAVLAWLLIAGEAVCGLWFLSWPRSRAAAPVWVFTAVSLVWSALAVQASARGLAVPDCGCFGRYLSQRLGIATLAQDALTLLYAAVLLRSRHQPGPAAVAKTRTILTHQKAETR
jgi:hypothetical protein